MEEGKWKKKQEEKGSWKIITRWDEEAREIYKEDGKKVGEKEENIEDKWRKLKELIEEALVERQIKGKKRGLEYKSQWDKSCTKEKRKVKRMLRQ